MREIFNLSESAIVNVEWVVLVLVVSIILNKVILFFLDQYLISQKAVPENFETKAHFSSSIFWFVFAVSLKMTLTGKSEKTLSIAVICVLAWLLTQVLGLVKIVIFNRFSASGENNLRDRKVRTKVQFIEKLVLIFVYILSVSGILMNFEGARELGGSLIASAGLAGITLGFAAQKSLSNLLAGFQIAFTQPIRIDDVVVVEGEWGRIEEITLTYVVIRTWDRRALILPITYFVEKSFQNWTRASSELVGVVYLYADYGLPIEPLRTEFLKFLKTCTLWDQKISNLQITNSTEKAVEIRLIMGARNAPEAFDLRCQVREHMISYIQRTFSNCLPQTRVSSISQAFQNTGDTFRVVGTNA